MVTIAVLILIFGLGCGMIGYGLATETWEVIPPEPIIED